MSLKSFDLRPLYLQVVDDFVGRIVSGDWPAGQFIASETEISRDLGLSIGTVRRAFDILDQYGLLDRSQGRGTMVLDAAGEEASQRFVTFVGKGGERVAGAIEVLSASIARADAAMARDLQVDPNAEILQLDRRRTFLGRVFSVERVHSPFVPAEREDRHLMVAAAGRWFAHNLAIRMSESVRPVLADRRDADALGIGEGEPILELTRIIYSHDNKPLERSVAHCYLGDDLHYESA